MFACLCGCLYVLVGPIGMLFRPSESRVSVFESCAAILNLRQSYSRLNIALVYSAVTRHLMQTVVDSCVQMVLVQ